MPNFATRRRELTIDRMSSQASPIRLFGNRSETSYKSGYGEPERTAM
jgi:hypothetical protein